MSFVNPVCVNFTGSGEKKSWFPVYIHFKSEPMSYSEVINITELRQKGHKKMLHFNDELNRT